MTFTNILDEAFADYVKDKYSKNKLHGVYKNPTSRELRDLVKEEKPSEIRFIVDKRLKEVYAFSSDLLHDEAAKKILKKQTSSMADRYVHGIADKKGNIISLRKHRLSNPKTREEFSWLKKYFSFPLTEESFNLDEVFLDYGVTGNKENFGIWKNPTRKDFEDMKKEGVKYGVRFIIDLDKGDSYIFSDELLHDNAIQKIYGRLSDKRNDFDSLVRGHSSKNGSVKYSGISKKAMKILNKNGLFKE